MNQANNRDEGLFATLFYFVFIPSYAYLSYYAVRIVFAFIYSFTVDLELHQYQYIFGIISFFAGLYYPIVLSLFFIWAFKYKSKIRIKRSVAITLWLLGGVVFIVWLFAALVLLLYSL